MQFMICFGGTFMFFRYSDMRIRYSCARIEVCQLKYFWLKISTAFSASSRVSGPGKEEMGRVGIKALIPMKIIHFSASGKDQSVAGSVFDNSLLLRSGTDIAADDYIGNDNVFEDSIHKQYDITADKGSQRVYRKC